MTNEGTDTIFAYFWLFTERTMSTERQFVGVCKPEGLDVEQMRDTIVLKFVNKLRLAQHPATHVPISDHVGDGKLFRKGEQEELDGLDDVPPDLVKMFRERVHIEEHDVLGSAGEWSDRFEAQDMLGDQL